jgi:uncharacterized protein
VNVYRRPDIRELDDNDVRSVLARNTVGRLAFCVDGDVDIRPLHYAFSHGRIYGRTGPGARFIKIEGNPARVAFEVDEVESVFHWTSVIARGHFHVLSGEGPDEAEWRRAIELLRRVIRDTFVADDPVPERNIIFRITVDEATGRSAR